MFLWLFVGLSRELGVLSQFFVFWLVFSMLFMYLIVAGLFLSLVLELTILL